CARASSLPFDNHFDVW
nr:immunoglobulin heavy chain junction region [Macaca mulatta]MOV35792.1 immunoglobulin heavy chain junction region [Macaca mulatta]MOV35808.1 immunoglobulin heavy chain junction region [Macaca mulatta]MOV35819.1 immunoglobulin heavy chain junction region [Macaca mulatta]MOV35825.1 immunoglobulin heavy chain junction region [Macaca mulatta]